MEAVFRAAKFASESAARVAVTTPVVSAAIRFSAPIVGVVVIFTVGSSTSTFVPAVTNAAVTSAAVPSIATALVTVTVPSVAPPIALNSAAVIAVALPSLIVTVASSTSTFVDGVTNAAVTWS